MNDVPAITQAEWIVMQVLWRHEAMSATEVYEVLESQRDWRPKTVRTLLGRLVAKGAVWREKRGGSYRFAPLVQEEDCLHQERKSFMHRCFGGRIRPMLAHFMEHEDLSNEDIAILRQRLDEIEKRKGKS